MNRGQRRRPKMVSRAPDSPPRQMHDVSITEMVDHVLRGADDVHVVVGPLLWRPTDGTRARYWYVVVATSERGRGFRCDQVIIPEDDRAIGEARRVEFLMVLMTRRPLVIHDCGDEVQMVRLCEVLWPNRTCQSRL
jgi:hypothetical protein